MTVAGWVGCVQYTASGRVGRRGARVQCPAAPDNAADSAPASVLRPQQTLDRVLELVNRPAFATNSTVLVSLPQHVTDVHYMSCTGMLRGGVK